MSEKRLKWLGVGMLVALLAIIGFAIVPRHATSIWMDNEFTDWISPIANRLHGDARLYANGLHIPMPPLPFVLVRLLHPGNATWIDENLLHYLFQAATILLLYFLLSRHTGVPIAFAASMALIPLFLRMGKEILYDSLAQFDTELNCTESWPEIEHLAGPN